MKKLTKEEFIRRAREIHGWKYDYSKIYYINGSIKVCIICPKHGEFWQSPKDHIKGRGCPKCGHERTNNSKKLTTETFIERAKQKYKNYSYENSNYLGFDKPITITCLKHGDFSVIAHRFLTGITGCPKCGIENMGPKRLTTEEFISRANKIHNNRYNYSKVRYVLSQEKVEIICSKHGSFFQTPNKHLYGRGCPICSESNGEMFVESILIENNYIFNKQFKILTKSNIQETLFVDFEIEIEDKIYLIEYNGEQHYKPVKIFGGTEKFIKQQNRDILLREFVLKNPNYKLLEIDYRWNKNTIKSKILNFLKDVPVMKITEKSDKLLENPKMDNQQPS